LNDAVYSFFLPPVISNNAANLLVVETNKQKENAEWMAVNATERTSAWLSITTTLLPRPALALSEWSKVK
jgi:hypothetical protein